MLSKTITKAEVEDLLVLSQYPKLSIIVRSQIAEEISALWEYGDLSTNEAYFSANQKQAAG